jgi:effector-binding domain-containing protein
VFTKPKLDHRDEQPYMGIRTQVPIRRMKKIIPKSLTELFDWLGKRDVDPAGPPFIRFHVIDMEKDMDIEVGVPVASLLESDGDIQPGVLPAGEYASLIYTGVKNGIKGNIALLEWAKAQGIEWDRWDDEKGDAFGGRYESFITDPKDQPDQAKWETEVAIRLADAHPAK